MDVLCWEKVNGSLKLVWKDFQTGKQELIESRKIEDFLRKEILNNMSLKENTFSSKPKQIAQAAKQVLLRVFNLNKISLIVISDMSLTLNIAENFKRVV